MIEKRLKASANQARYVKAELSGVGTYMISVGHLVQGPFDESAFRKATDALLTRHAALRTSFEISGDVFAVVNQKPAYRYHVCKPKNECLASFRRWALPLVFNDVDPRIPGALIRFLVADHGTSWRFTIAGHHAISDGVSRNLMNKELLELYSGKSLAPAGSYYDFINHDDRDQTIDGVEEYVLALPTPARIIGDGNGTNRGQYVELVFGELAPRLLPLAKSLGTSKFGFLSAVYALGLRGYTGENNVTSFFQSAGRRSLRARNTVVGSFSNTLPLDLSVDPEKEFATFASEILVQTKSIVALENAPLMDAVIDAQKAPSVSINLFPREVPISLDTLTVGPREFLDRRTEYDLNLVWSEEHGELTARAFYNSAHLSETRAKQFLEFQSRLLDVALRDPHLSCQDLIQTARVGMESVEIAQNVNPAPTRRIHSSFFEWARKNPGATAIKTSRETISYGALAKSALDIVQGLQAAGLGEGNRVAIFAQRDPQTIAAMLGVSASGASFALIDANYPAARIKMMLDSLETNYIIEAGADLPPEIAKVTTKILPAPWEHSADLEFEGEPRAEAYHLFTSGTTNRPKLATHPDKTLQRFIGWQHETLNLSEPVTTVMMAGLAHDPTLRDVFLPLSFGGGIAIPTSCEMAEPQSLRQLIKSANCNVLRIGPTTARLLTVGMSEKEAFLNLKAVFWGGERLPCETVKRWQLLAENARQFNVFGATETPQAFLIHEIDPNTELARDIPIGRPMPWSGVRLVDIDGRPVSVGEVGEIVADLADPVVGTYRRIADDPAIKNCVHYTGDLGYQSSEGSIHFVGRKDDQVKINGFRVELSEIEATAETISTVQRASAIANDDSILLFIKSDSTDCNERSVRAELAKRLPSYMIPGQVFILNEFPYTANGKIDQAALRNIASSPLVRADVDLHFEAPKGPTEIALADVFARHSGRSGIDRKDTLSDLGADSLSSIEARFEIEKLGIGLPNDWLWKPLVELAAVNNKTGNVKSSNWGLLSLARTDMFILLRFFAIVSVVLFHTGFQLTGGASIVLFALAGYSFAGLQLPSILADGNPSRVWDLMAKLLIPLIPMSLVYFGLNVYRDVDTHISSLLFFRNLTEIIGALFLPGSEPVKGLVWLWFLHVYLQIFLILGLLLSSSTLRRVLVADVWYGILKFFFIVEVVNLITVYGVSILVGDPAEAGRLLHRTPFAILPFLVLGGLIVTAETTQRSVLSFLVIAFHLGVVALYFGDHGELWWVLALVLCAAVPYIKLPLIVSKIVVAVAAYTLMIYLTHHAVFLVMYKFFGGGDVARASMLLAQISFGVLFGILMNPIIRQLSARRLFRLLRL